MKTIELIALILVVVGAVNGGSSGCFKLIWSRRCSAGKPPRLAALFTAWSARRACLARPSCGGCHREPSYANG